MVQDGKYVGLFSKSGAEESRSRLKIIFVITGSVDVNGYDLLGNSYVDVGKKYMDHPIVRRCDFSVLWGHDLLAYFLRKLAVPTIRWL